MSVIAIFRQLLSGIAANSAVFIRASGAPFAFKTLAVSANPQRKIRAPRPKNDPINAQNGADLESYSILRDPKDIGH